MSNNNTSFNSNNNSKKNSSDSTINEEKTFHTQHQQVVVHVKLKCQGCGSMVNLKRALKDRWGMCEICGSFMCKTCQVDYATYSENVCPGSRIMEHHQVQISQIPLDKILEFVRDMPEQLETNPVFRAFYEDFSKIADPFGEVIYEFTPMTRIRNKYEEQWLKLKNIIIQKTRNDVIKY